MWGLGCCGVAAIFFHLASKDRSKAARMRKTPTTRVRDLTPGFRELKGKVAASGELLRSPLTKSRCVFFELKVEEERTSRSGGSSSTNWHTVVEDRQTAGLMLDDGTGQCPVDIADAELMFEPDTQRKSGILNDAPPEVETTLQERYGISSEGALFNKSMRYTETVLKPGEMLYVLGTAVPRGNGLTMEKAGDLFIIGDRTEGVIAGKFSSAALAKMVLSVVLALLGGMCLIAGAGGVELGTRRRRH